MENHNIRADVSLEVNSFLSVNGYIYGESISLSLISITDIRQIETMFTEITLKLSSSPQKKHLHHISKAKEHIEAIFNRFADETRSHCSDLPKLQFILGQLENVGIYKKRRRYNVITQILAMKAHLYSPDSYKFLQSSECISFPHVHTLEKLYSSFGLVNDFCTYLSQLTSFTYQEKNVIVQMDEIHVKSDMNQKDIRKTFHFPNFQIIKLDYCVYPVQVYSASFSDVRLLYASGKETLAKLAFLLLLSAKM